MANADITSAVILRLALLGEPLPADATESSGWGLVAPMVARQREFRRRLADRLCPADERIQQFLDSYLAEASVRPKLPRRTLVLDEPGLARELSLPEDGDEVSSSLLSSYRLVNGVLHNPANDRRTTQGVFHIAEGGLPIQDDKLAAPLETFARMLELALDPPADDKVLPWTANNDKPAHALVSLLLRPLVVPAVPGRPAITMETRFIVPGALVANLDFVEGIFGNAGDPYLPENDAALDPATWTGHTGCVILAPHLTKVTKKAVGLPHVDQATERQKRDGMCWSSEDELYNNGQAFKLVARDARGVVVTMIADNYFGYCKKEIKTQISYSANIYGHAEEEHAGGAICHSAYNLGPEFIDKVTPAEYTVAEVLEQNPGRFDPQPEGHAYDTLLPNLVLVPAYSTYSLNTQTVSWEHEGQRHEIPLLAGQTYMGPNGYQIHSKQRELDKTQWHLIGISPIAMQCHKPATVSGGGKSEISKSLLDAFVFTDQWTADFSDDIEAVADLISQDWSQRFIDEGQNDDARSIMSPDRSLGSVIKLLTPSSLYTPEYNERLAAIPPHIKELLFTIKRYHRVEWGDDWRSHFGVSVVNGRLGNVVRLDGDKVISNMLRVGFEADGSWRLFSLRPDFSPAVKVQTEDDITASTVVPMPDHPLDFSRRTGARAALEQARQKPGRPVSRKFVKNCEQLLFQRPDDAIHRGYDKQAERDISSPGTFLSNFQPITRDEARAIVRDAVGFSQFTEPMQQLLRDFAAQDDDASPKFVVSSANPRLVDGKPSKNPRYLQTRPDHAQPEATMMAEMASHLVNHRPLDEFFPLPVDVVAAGRRNNPPEEGVPALCGYNPLHYMELPELFMEFISSMTGKSPSTTGAGSEGALTKGPFNMLPSILDLNASLLSYALSGYDGWVSSAGYIGPHTRIDHDFSLLVPELFARMGPAERDASWLIEQGYLDAVPDFEHEGRTVQASRLGHRINERFVTTFFGRIFLHPDKVFTPEMLAPELQDPKVYADSVDVVVTTHQRVAQSYIDDGTIEWAVPPLRALLEVMALGQSAEGWTLHSPELRRLFERDEILASDWYAERLDAQQELDVNRVSAAVEAISHFIDAEGNVEPVGELGMTTRLRDLHEQLERVKSAEHRESLVGTLGRQPL
ncbi:hypothetical protein [Aestuariimicrobium ganziense]|uniref:hypothetical protein n=1 Tax=Aestuariimicrobium ganziense TaxID=2773677 RepID=UPI001941F555|nr:hypothetical protein [Aestuariimicrobium ganziense]